MAETDGRANAQDALVRRLADWSMKRLLALREAADEIEALGGDQELIDRLRELASSNDL